MTVSIHKMKILNQVLVFLLKMNIIHLILMTEFVFVKGADEPSDVPTQSSTNHVISSNHICTALQSEHPSLPLDQVKIGITNGNEVIQHVDMIKTKRVLANEHLPIWILNQMQDTDNVGNGIGNKLERNYEVMEQLGKFSFYQEAKTSSAATYFHKRREFDGMIGYEFLIKKLSVDKIHPRDEVSFPLEECSLYRRPDYDGHGFENFDDDAGNTVGVNYQQHMTTYENKLYDGYPEILVIVSWDVKKLWTKNVKNVDHYTTIVSRVLTLFNGVDMLYSKLDNTNIQINIAGIIIGKTQKSFDFLQQCYRFQTRGNKRLAYRLDGPCVNYHLARYLHIEKETIPLQSYDSVVYLTRENLYRIITNSGTNEIQTIFRQVTGTSRCIHDLYNSKRRAEQFVPVSSITTKKYLDRYPTIAHEIAHLMTVLHDNPPYFTEDDTCSGYIMRSNSNCCANCLSWSTISRMTFKLFFSSPNCCSFINKPISLYQSGRQIKLTADEQCRCYGYESAKVFEIVPENFCQVKLQCKGADNEIHDTVIPLDGTPCNNNKVCWQMKCQEVQMIKQSNQQNEIE